LALPSDFGTSSQSGGDASLCHRTPQTQRVNPLQQARGRRYPEWFFRLLIEPEAKMIELQRIISS